MYIIIILLGIISIILGICRFCSKRFYLWMENRVRKSKYDIKLFTSQESYFVRRYLAGFQFIVVGVALIALYWIFTTS
jgi:hypothetical protein